MGRGTIRGSGGAKVSSIKNKVKRVAVYQKLKKEGQKKDREGRKIRQKEAEALGEDAPKPPPQRTLDNTRETEESMVRPGDDEVIGEDSFDEFASHFAGEAAPRIVVTTSRYPSRQLLSFLEEVVALFPNAEYRQRGAVPIKAVVKAAAKRDFTMLLVFTEKAKVCHGLWMVKLPEGCAAPGARGVPPPHSSPRGAAAAPALTPRSRTPAQPDRALQAEQPRHARAHRRPWPGDGSQA